MSTSDRSFEQVKNILGKLDRNIDAARARRLHTNSPVPAGVPRTPAVVGVNGQQTAGAPQSGSSALIGASAQPSHAPAVPAQTPRPAMPSKSGFGRARPLRPSGANQP